MIKTSKIVEIDIPSYMRGIAFEKGEKMGNIKNSILKGDGNMTGFLGEEVVKKWLEDKGKVSGGNTYQYDFKFNEWKCEVKSKLTTVKPQSNYDCSIASYNPNQGCDWYIFVRVLDTLNTAWILGFLSKEEYFKKAIFMKKGDIDPSNNFRVKADCYNVKISELRDIKELPNIKYYE